MRAADEHKLSLDDAGRLQDARSRFRRGYAWIDAVANAGLDPASFPYDEFVTESDEQAHDGFWWAAYNVTSPVRKLSKAADESV